MICKQLQPFSAVFFTHVQKQLFLLSVKILFRASTD